MKYFFSLLASLCLHFSGRVIAENIRKDSVFIIHGNIAHSPSSSTVYLFYQTNGKRFIDSCKLDNGNFRLKGIAIDPVHATLVLARKGLDLSQLMKTPVDEIDALKFYLHPGEIEIGAQDSVSAAVFKGSSVNADYARLKTLLNTEDERRLIRLSARMKRLKTAGAVRDYTSFYDSLKAARRPLLKQYAQNNPSSFIALVALQDYAGAFPDTAEIKPLFMALAENVRNTRAGIAFDALLSSNIMVGKPAPDFVQYTPDGKPIRLSSFRGKFVLVDFWASWCGPCREENPAWVKVFNKLKDKNFTILGVSLDGHDTRTAWIKAIKDDGLSWPQVSDLRHWDNTVIKQYGINAIPQNVLIDPAGMVAAKNIEPDELIRFMTAAH